MIIETHSAFKTPEPLRHVVAEVQKIEKQLRISPMLLLVHVRMRIENDIAVLLKDAPALLKEMKVKLRTFANQSHIDLIHDTKEHSAVLITIIFRKGGQP